MHRGTNRRTPRLIWRIYSSFVRYTRVIPQAAGSGTCEHQSRSIEWRKISTLTTNVGDVAAPDVNTHRLVPATRSAKSSRLRECRRYGLARSAQTAVETSVSSSFRRNDENGRCGCRVGRGVRWSSGRVRTIQSACGDDAVNLLCGPRTPFSLGDTAGFYCNLRRTVLLPRATESLKNPAIADTATDVRLNYSDGHQRLQVNL
jgi:hypothetical protein